MKSQFIATGTLCMSALVCSAQYRVVPGEADKDGCLPRTPARICMGADHCYAMPKTKDYIFGLEPQAKPAGNLDGQELTLFSATFSGCGSGTLTSFALLTSRSGELVDILPEVRLTNQSEYKLWNLPQISQLPVLVTADFIWDFGRGDPSKPPLETHFARHRYAIRAFVFDPATLSYAERIHFKTTKKYPGLDEVEAVHVLEPERMRVVEELQRTRSQ